MAELSVFIPKMRSLRFFSGISDAEILQVLERGEIVPFSAGKIIFHEGEDSDGNAYIILSGAASVMIEDRTVATLSSGDVFGEYALISNEPRTATVQADSSMECISIDEHTLLDLVSNHQDLNTIMTERIKSNIRANLGVFRNS